MSIALVQHRTIDVASATSATISFLSSTTPGNIIIVAVRVGGTSTAAFTDDKSGGSNVYNGGPGAQGSDVSLVQAALGTGYIFSAKNAGAATTLTCTLTGGATTMRIAIYEYSGIDTASPLDKTSSLYTATGPTSANSGNTATTTQASELLFGMIANNASETPIAGITQSYVIEDTVPAAPSARLAVEDVVVSATGAYQADFGTLNSSTDHICLIATYKAAGAGGSTIMLGIIIEPSSGPEGVTQQVSQGWM